MEPFDFNNRIILLTGATGGLGSSMARMLSDQGAKLILSARSEKALAGLVHSLSHPENAAVIPADLARPEEVERLAKESEKIHGRVDVLFNNAGVGYLALMEEADESRIRHLFEVNTFAPLNLMRAFVSGMKTRGGGRIINIVSCSGRVPIPSVGVYGGSKSALAIMANTMRIELAPFHIDLINIYPGTVDTAFEEHALREEGRDPLCPTDSCGLPRDEIAEKVLRVAKGPAGEVWLENEGRWMSAASVIWPGMVERRLAPMHKKVVTKTSTKPKDERKWRLWQVETSFTCNLKCVMCPWRQMRKQMPGKGLMEEKVWGALSPWLSEVGSIDFSGGGEALMHPRLLDWISEARAQGCTAGFLTNGTLLDKDKAMGLINAGVDWITFSSDGADAATFEEIRRGADFETVCANIENLSGARIGKHPSLGINFVMMKENVHQLQEIVKLAARLAIDRVTFKQCDVVRGNAGEGHGLFGSAESKQIRKYEKELNRARKLARRLGVETTAFSFVPEQQPICDQNPTNSLFVRYDGAVSPCINLALGGPSKFFGEDVIMPSVHYGRLPDSSLEQLWETKTCRFFQERFSERDKVYETSLLNALYEPSISMIKKAKAEAGENMPKAPDGCRTCHYLYDV